jgi:hypothetical protein
MPGSDPDRPRRRRPHSSHHNDERRALGQIDELRDPLVDPEDPPDPSEASDPETVANAKASE